MKKWWLMIVSVVILLVSSGCQMRLSSVETGISFDPDKVFLLSEDHLAVVDTNVTKVYTLDRFKGKADLLAQIDGEYTLSDSVDGRVLLENKSRLLCYGLKNKTMVDIFDAIFTDEEQQMRIRYRSFFAEDGDRLIVTKILYDKTKPILIGGIESGYEVSTNSGVYIYDYTGEKPQLEHAVTMEALGLSCTGANDITFVARDLKNGNVALFAQIGPIIAAVSDQYFINVNIQNGTATQFGSYLLGENQDAVMRISHNGNHIVVVNSKRVLCADFTTQTITKSEYVLSGVKSIDVLHNTDADTFYVYIQASDAYLYNQYILNKNKLEVQSVSKETEMTRSLLKNCGVRGNALLQLSAEEVQQYPDAPEAGIVYRSYTDAGYLCEQNGNTTVIYK